MRRRVVDSLLLQALVVVGVGALVYVPFLGTKPLDNSEGHRAVPGWTMLRTGDWWHQEMFGLTYLRKPPGMAWAIGASSSVLGESEWGARAPSALAAVLAAALAWVMVTRWMGRPWGLAAGLAQALMPLMWAAGRTAEIEMLDVLGGQLLAFGVVEGTRGRWERPASEAQSPASDTGAWSAAARPRPGGPGSAAIAVALVALGAVVSALAKGPANAPVLVGALVGAAVAGRSWRALGAWPAWAGLTLAGAALVPLAVRILDANGGPDAVREDVADKFLWSWSRAAGVLTLPPAAWAAALPASLAWALVWFRPAVEDDPAVGAAGRVARVCAWAWLAGVLALVAAGVSNPRYAMPLAVLMPPVAAWGLMVASAGAWMARWRGAGRALTFGGRPALWLWAMLMVAWWYLVLTQTAPTADQAAGRVLASRLEGGIVAAAALERERRSGAPYGGTAPWRPEVWADDAIESRPDVFWALERSLPDARVRWRKRAMLAGELPPAGTLLVLRTDGASGEAARYAPHIGAGRLWRVAEGRLRTHVLAMYAVIEGGPERAPGP